ncbi:DNA mismatch repair endonuclease MutL [Brevibacillus massiliensis]|uniref:DNA mismatch repair endonuclease MutL n=1 Tax=Brevibacillus massiliensis TaxID=1118054 RepID=UPI00030C03E2|nr:DNA mismatch repair endonuclease MutL [Brevibacillus massiliensis]
MGIIQVMDDQLSNMIAAGEVVERPASVVKELVENAIDAMAKRIEIHVEEGGLGSIRIVDDGHGMERSDCLLAFERHATSKIRTTRDLFQIRTLGFRGEALPSIASVARVELTSTDASGKVGTQIVVEGGKVQSVTDAAAVQGTQIVIRDLFFNTPARLKYMKSISTEIGHISDFVNRLALAYPGIAFTLTHNGKMILQTSGDGKLLHVMAAIYGVQVAKLLLPVSGETLDFRWSGYLAKTEVTRANRSYISTLVNGRYIRSYPLTNAIMRGYHTLLPVGRFPIVALQLEMDPTLVDVNVHPAKLEARFSKEQELCEAIETAVRTALRQGLRIVQPLQAERRGRGRGESLFQPQLELNPAGYTRPAVKMEKIDSAVFGQSRKLPTEAEVRERFLVKESGVTEQPSAELQVEAAHSGAETAAAAEPSVQAASAAADDAAFDAEASAAQGSASAGEAAEAAAAIPMLYPVGQVHGTYIVAQNETGMYLIDQHAAQERIYYEFFMEKLQEESASSQLLLFPHTVECTAAEEARLLKRLELLRSLGLEAEWFGSRTFIVRAHPSWFPQGSELEVIDELIQFVLEAGEQARIDIREMREKAAIMMSCKASIKANRFLTHAEMEALLERLRMTKSPFTCPHGRPIIIHFSTYELEKMFKRVM